MGRFSRRLLRQRVREDASRSFAHPSSSRFRRNARNQGDGRDLLASIDDGIVALVIADPQYRGVLDQLDYGNEGARQVDRAALPQMPDAMITEFGSHITRVLRPSGHLMLWCDKFTLVEGTWRGWLGDALKQVDMVTWKKPRLGMGYRTRRKSEYLLIFQKPPLRVAGVWHDHGIPDVWDVDEAEWQREHLRGWGSGPHRKPVSLQSRLIAAVTKPGDLVIDPSAGSYSVLDAARFAGRDFLGCDLRG